MPCGKKISAPADDADGADERDGVGADPEPDEEVDEGRQHDALPEALEPVQHVASTLSGRRRRSVAPTAWRRSASATSHQLGQPQVCDGQVELDDVGDRGTRALAPSARIAWAWSRDAAQAACDSKATVPQPRPVIRSMSMLALQKPSSLLDCGQHLRCGRPSRAPSMSPCSSWRPGHPAAGTLGSHVVAVHHPDLPLLDLWLAAQDLAAACPGRLQPGVTGSHGLLVAPGAGHDAVAGVPVRRASTARCSPPWR